MKNIIKISILCSCIFAFSANAFEYNSGRSSFKLSGYGTYGTISPDFKNASSLNDWRVRSQFNYAIAPRQTLGAVYSIDALAVSENQPLHDAFIFAEDSYLGRIEFGATDSIAKKLGVGMPDVSGLRLNNYPVLYKKIPSDGLVISNTTTNSGRYRLRVNLASVPTRPVQYGLSFSSFSNTYDYMADFGIKYRQPNGKTKLAISVGGSFIDNPNSFTEDIYLPAVNADYRAQLSSGISIQYNSWIWGLSARAIFDKDSIGVRSDGVVAGTGISYDLLNYTVSASYLFSDTGVWDTDVTDYNAHTGLLSFRYKYSKYLDGWISGGISDGTPFTSAGLRLKF